MEIYNEKVRDLLDTSGSKSAVHNLKIREHPKDGPYVESMLVHYTRTINKVHNGIVCLKRSTCNDIVRAHV